MNANGLKLVTIKSEVRPIIVQNGLLENVVEHFSDGNAVVAAYLDYMVLIGRFENKSFVFYKNETIDAKFVQKLRVFNSHKELLFWRSKDVLKGRNLFRYISW